MLKTLLYLVIKYNKAASYKISTYKWVANNELHKKEITHLQKHTHACMYSNSHLQ